MPPQKTTMGFEGQIFADSASGGSAATQLTNVTDANLTVDPEFSETTTRGDGTSVPIVTEGVCALKWSADWNMLEKASDTSLAMLKTAAAAGSPIALRMKDKANGKGFDGDVLISHKHGKPLKGVQTHDFTATPTTETDSPRTPQIYV